jgi:chloramphenicol 3-O-phosphotransferase
LEKGRIIILNGVSSVGKSTLAKTLQERLSDPFYLMDVDTFVRMAPEKYRNNLNFPHIIPCVTKGTC